VVDVRAEDFIGTERFRVQRRLGSGAFGVVYEALDLREGHTVALKVLRHPDADALYRFKKDFRSLADIRHPNLVSFYELIHTEGFWFFSMELVHGVDFIEYLTGCKTADGEEDEEWAFTPHDAMGYERIRRALTQLARGLHTVHRHGKVHRDIKPSNVLVTPQGRVVLLDFGLVTELVRYDTAQASPQATPQLVGTPAYMAPEQALGIPGSPAGDWYSVGIMLFLALCGELPFKGSLGQILTRKQIGDAPQPRQWVPDIPDDLDTLCRELLDPEPEKRPSGRQILERLSLPDPEGPTERERSTAVGVGEEGSESLFVGREETLDALEEAWRASREEAVSIYLKGPSGIGMSAVTERFVERIHRRNPRAVLLLGRCYPQESVPYKALDSLVDSLSRFLFGRPPEELERLLPPGMGALARVFPVLRRIEAVARRESAGEGRESTPQRQRHQAFEALRELLRRIAAERPVLLLIDDLHWGDVDSFQLLDHLLAIPNPPPLLLVGVYRAEDEADSPFVRALAEALETPAWRSRDVRRLELSRLSRREVDELMHRLEQSRGLPPGLVDVVGEAEGNPLFIAELLRYAESLEISQEPAGGEAQTTTGELHLRDLIMARIERLEPAALRLLRVAATAATPLDREVARQAADIGGELGRALRQLRAAKLLRQRSIDGEVALETYHDRIRETVMESLDPGERRDLHRALALVLESSGRAAPETLAVHFQAGQLARSREYLTSAAREAEEALAFDRAARLYRMALELLPAEDEGRYEIQVRLGTALANAGRSRDAAETYIQAVGDSGTINPVEVQRRAAEKLLVSGHIDRGMAVLRHVLRTQGMELGERGWRSLLRLRWARLQLRLRGLSFSERDEVDCDPERLRRIDVCWSVTIGLCLVDIQHAAEYHAHHLRLALEAGEPRRVARGLAMEIFFGAMEGHSADVTRETARRLASRFDGTYTLGLTEMAAGMVSCSRGLFRQAHGQLRDAEIALRESRRGAVWELDTVHHFRILAMVALGQLPELFEELPGLLERARDRGDLYLETHLLNRGESVRLLAEDRPGEAHHLLVGSMGSWACEGFHFQHFGHLLARVQVALYEGRGLEARELLAAHRRALAGSQLERLELVRVEAHELRARAALAAAAQRGRAERGAPSRLLAEAERHLKRLEAPGASGWSSALAELHRGALAALRGQGERAISHLEGALVRFEQLHMPLHAAAARLRRAELLAAAGAERSRVREQWERGAQTFEERGVRSPERFVALLAPGLITT
jgi:serine/threonine protein kinase